MRILITGITGFVGSHLADFLLTKENVEVYGIKRWRSRTENIEHLKGKIILKECDLRDGSSVRRVINEIRPQRIFHLAGQSFVPTSWRAPEETISTNIMAELNIFEAVRQIGINPWIQIAGSSEEYGMVYENELPVKETNPLRPLSPYAVSKVTQDLLGYQYFMSYRLNIVRTRGFNHTGPRRPPVFVCSDFAKQIVEIEKDLCDPTIYVGSLEAKRDFTDVRDIIRGYWLALEKGIPGEIYNICSGKAWVIKDLLDKLLGISEVKDIKLEQDPTRMRPSDVQILQGDCSKIMEKTGWKPEIPFDQTLTDLRDYWRERL